MGFGWTVSTDFVAAPQYQIARKSIQQYWSCFACSDKETDGTSECYVYTVSGKPESWKLNNIMLIINSC